MIGSLATAFSFTKLMSIKVKRIVCPTCVVLQSQSTVAAIVDSYTPFVIRIAYNIFATFIDFESNVFLSISVVEEKNKNNALAALN